MVLKPIWRSAFWFVALKSRIEEAFVPLASPSCELATLAFFAVFNVLIKDFFWIDILGSLLLKFCLSRRRNIHMQRACQSSRAHRQHRGPTHSTALRWFLTITGSSLRVNILAPVKN